MKRKVDVENRLCNDEWTDKYVFIMPTICNVTTTKYASFKESYPKQSEAHQGKM